MKELNRIKLKLVENKKTSKWLAIELGKTPCTVSHWCLLLTLCFLCSPTYAQYSEELNDIFYDIGFRSVTSDIDPIEGAYAVSTDTKVLLNNEVIKQQHYDGDITIYSSSNGVIREYNNQFEFFRIGITQTYDVNVLWPEYNITQHERIRINYTDFINVSFSLTYEMPQEKIKAMFGNYYVPGIKVVCKMTCKKILPDKKLINEIADIIKKRKESEVVIWTGTGFSISDNLIATNYHVVDEAKNIYLTNETVIDTIPASIIATDINNDIAILSISKETLPKIKYSIIKEQQKTGTNIFVLGYPLTNTMGNEIKATSGIISSQTGFKGDNSLYQISAPIQPGNSGGPLFNMNGSIVGIVCAHHKQAENAGYAIKTKHLFELCNRNNIIIKEEHVFINESEYSLSELIEKFKQNVFHVICIK